jgi:hypothetical protein
MSQFDYTVLKAGWREWLIATIWEFLVTIQFGVPLREHLILDSVWRFGGLVDYYWLGHGFYKKPSAERTQYIGVPERGPKEGNMHVHLLLNRPPSVAVPDDWRRNAEAEAFSKIFTSMGRHKGVCPNGDIHFKRIGSSEDDQVRCVSYVLTNYSGRDSVILP